MPRASPRTRAAPAKSTATNSSSSSSSSSSSRATKFPSNTAASNKRKRQQPESEPESEAEGDERENDEDDDDEADGEEEEEDEEEEDEGELEFSGTKDKKGEWLDGTLTYSLSNRVHYKGQLKNGVKHGQGTMFFPDGSSLKGPFTDDVIDGDAVYTGADGSTISGKYNEGNLEGIVVEKDENGMETFRGMYVDSVRHGEGKLNFLDGGSLVGQFVQGEFEGKKNKYLYPAPIEGKEASLRGEWKSGVMKKSQFYIGDELIEPKLSYTFDESTATRIAKEPLLSDPFEVRKVYVKPSQLPDSGEGLWALVDLPPNTIVTYYNGTRDKAYKAEKRKWSENANTISLIDDDPEMEIDIDVDEKNSTTKVYKASLAHKCNHSFDPNQVNAMYDMCLHPRFGLIKSIRTLKPVKKDEELFVDYGYSVKIKEKDGSKRIVGNAGPEWYRKAFANYHDSLLATGGAKSTAAAKKGSAKTSDKKAEEAKSSPAPETASSNRANKRTKRS